MQVSSRVTPLEASEFDTFIGQQTGAVVVDFWAPWCGPCRALAPTLERLAENLEGAVAVRKVNVDEAPELAAAFGVRSIPTLILFRDGKAMSQVVGAQSESQLAKWVGTAL
ncbi:thiol reductase thioredoxin [Hydrogenophaga crassostreae]|uniref:Thioredoxin n=1 Tax=Hydrogenophaga crassostreae TaxID=1763535 RepID=A0A162YRV9_9BURK|nr:thioredoxin [Hydrogenophaga crassostreae]AOW11644.1 thioredoxin [Hydrogenophaga crassostreae]OAD39737.1 thiol reductase thioredoxin [Hydrogenophaga crassostreae]